MDSRTVISNFDGVVSAAPFPADGEVNNSNINGTSTAALHTEFQNFSSPQQACNWREDFYAAETPVAGIRVFFRVVPLWVPVVSFISLVGTYYAIFRIRLFLSKWRLAERRRAERKYDLLDNLRGVPMGPVGAVEPLGDDDVDEEEEEDDDITEVSMRDIDEFRSSLGIRLPRDEDLLAVVENMLKIDPIPDGWVLYRTTAGIIRFMNLSTQELFFFHPGKRKEKAFIEAELRKRNRQAMERKYNFYYEDEGLNSFSMSNRSAAFATSSGPSPIDFGEDGVCGTEDETQTSTFRRLFHYFLEREQKCIEQDVARSRSAANHRSSEASAGGTIATSTSGFSLSANAAGGCVGSGTGGSAEGDGGSGSSGIAATAGSGGLTSTTHNPEAVYTIQRTPGSVPTSMTYRVVSSNAIHGGRSGVGS